MKLAMTATVLVLGVACATKKLPPGTPPPEYERRTFEPWPPAAVDAGQVPVDAGQDDAATVAPQPSEPSVAPAPSAADAGPGAVP